MTSGGTRTSTTKVYHQKKTTTSYDGEQYTTYEEGFSDSGMEPLVQRFGQVQEGQLYSICFF